MIDVLPTLQCWHDQGEEIALATLVRVHGSAPRRPGARLCLTRSGKIAGSVSGGCVESAVVEQGQRVLDSGRPEIVSYELADEPDLAVGLACGSIDVLIEPFVPLSAWQAVRQALDEQRAVALAIALAPADVRGRKLAILDGNETVGSIHPELDAQVAVRARRLLEDGGVGEVELRMGGQPASVFIEAFPRPPRLLIVGATDAATHLCRLAAGLGYRVTVVDPRAPFATTERFPDASGIVRAWPEEAIDPASLDERSYVVTLTHDPKFDLPALAIALRSPARYIGALGSVRTHARRKAKLQQQGVTHEELARIRAPIGLDIGARTPEELAVSILAEMLAVRYERDGRSLTERRAEIHAEAPRNHR